MDNFRLLQNYNKKFKQTKTILKMVGTFYIFKIFKKLTNFFSKVQPS